MRLIDADAIPVEELDYHVWVCLKKQPTIEAVPREVVNAIQWERDVAIKQLEEHGITFGCKADDVVKVVRCKDCKHYKQNPYSKEKDMMCMCWCDWLATDTDDFCRYGERRDNT